MKILLLIVFITLPVWLAGCASIVDGTNQTVTIKTAPVKGARCQLSNKKGRWIVAKTPGSVIVHRARGDLKVSCKKNGRVIVSNTVKSKLKKMFYGNLIFGGLLGMGLDIEDGAAYDYPETINLLIASRCVARARRML